MGEIVNVQVGQCGNRIGSKFWEVISGEHGIDPTGYHYGNSDLQLERINVYYQETMGKHFYPRAVIVDLEPSTMDSVHSGPYGGIFKPGNCIFGTKGSSHNWAKGHYTLGAEIVDDVLDVIRKEVESCDSFHGFHFFHSLGGGTGSGMGTLLMRKLHDEHSHRMMTSFSVLPSPKLTKMAVEPYNAILAMNKLLEYSTETFCIDNESLFKIATQNSQSPSNSNLNNLIGSAMSGITASTRFPGILNTDLRKLAVNLIPFPRLQFLMTGIVPFPSHALTVPELTEQIFNPNNILADCNIHQGKYMAASAIFRGRMSLKEVNDQMIDMQNKNSDNFVDWIPNNVMTTTQNNPPPGVELTATSIGNNTAIQEAFQRLSTKFDRLYKNRGFTNLYTEEGMDTYEFAEAEKNTKDLISEYQQCQS
uniref:Tubulin beta chain n=1 Tax=Ciona savignyi TaxID=51511 RepID=H2Y4E9_CIOSA